MKHNCHWCCQQWFNPLDWPTQTKSEWVNVRVQGSVWHTKPFSKEKMRWLYHHSPVWLGRENRDSWENAWICINISPSFEKIIGGKRKFCEDKKFIHLPVPTNRWRINYTFDPQSIVIVWLSPPFFGANLAPCVFPLRNFVVSLSIYS